jgi:hypothetical protein
MHAEFNDLKMDCVTRPYPDIPLRYPSETVPYLTRYRRVNHHAGRVGHRTADS